MKKYTCEIANKAKFGEYEKYKEKFSYKFQNKNHILGITSTNLLKSMLLWDYATAEMEPVCWELGQKSIIATKKMFYPRAVI